MRHLYTHLNIPLTHTITREVQKVNIHWQPLILAYAFRFLNSRKTFSLRKAVVWLLIVIFYRPEACFHFVLPHWSISINCWKIWMDLSKKICFVIKIYTQVLQEREKFSDRIIRVFIEDRFKLDSFFFFFGKIYTIFLETEIYANEKQNTTF